jgi:hypothetical protein
MKEDMKPDTYIYVIATLAYGYETDTYDNEEDAVYGAARLSTMAAYRNHIIEVYALNLDQMEKRAVVEVKNGDINRVVRTVWKPQALHANSYTVVELEDEEQ